jgi:hypothetical protein
MFQFVRGIALVILRLVPGELAPRKSGSELDEWQAKNAHHAQGN